MAWVRSLLHLDTRTAPPEHDPELADAQAALAIQRRKAAAQAPLMATAYRATDSLAEAVDRALRGRR
jgi:hypothetical protein